MKLKIKYIKDIGTVNERLVIQVNETCDIGQFIVFTVEKAGEDILTDTLKNPFWFPDKIVNKGDILILYTKIGSETFKVNATGNKSFFYYRNLSKQIYNNYIFSLLIETNNWQVDSK